MATVLIVEDETTLAETLRYNLEREGYSVIVAADGVHGLDRARRDQPDLVVLDIMLPGSMASQSAASSAKRAMCQL